MKKFKILVRNRSEEVQVLEKMNDEGKHWAAGEPAIKFVPSKDELWKALRCKFPYLIYFNGEEITYDTDDFSKEYENISVDEYLNDSNGITIKAKLTDEGLNFLKDILYAKNEDRDHCEIHITTKDNVTHGILKKDGEIVKRSTSRCHPDDEFNFEFGALMAFARLFDANIEIKKAHEAL